MVEMSGRTIEKEREKERDLIGNVRCREVEEL